GSYEFTNRIIAGVEKITLEAASSITFLDKATALLVHSATNDGAVKLEGDVFTGAERQQLYNQGIRTLTDASGEHMLQPVAALLSAAKAQEGAATGAAVGDLTATDPNPSDGLSFSLANSAGGRFKIVGNQIQVANGVLLDYEQATSHTVVVRATDAGGLVTDTAFTISVGDVAAEKVTGTSASEVLKGGKGKDVFSGSGGNDRLWGGLGNDALAGGAGKDAFVFDTAPSKSANRDTISDFSAKDDSLWLDNKIFTKLGKAGSVTKPAALNKGFFALDAAKDKNDYLIYNRKTGVLSYDADGSGAKVKAVEIAVLKKNLALTYKDFFVI
ncbi:MAG TPA: cadherin domain-containing protein, partial [Microvirga sp.]|nr:cadherin domain-containing protein [Microvirga sp.]